jgi:hypothetical protein
MEMFQHDFQFFAHLIIFLKQRKGIKYSLFIFIFHNCAKFQTKKKKKKKKLIMTCAFGCFQSHCNILKELHEFLALPTKARLLC